MLSIQNVDLNYVLLLLSTHFLYIITAVVALVHYYYRSFNCNFHYRISAIISIFYYISYNYSFVYLLCYYVSFLHFHPFPIVLVVGDVVAVFSSLKLNYILPFPPLSLSIIQNVLHIIFNF